MQAGTRDVITCPSCGEKNMQGADNCEHCLADLSSISLPSTAQPMPGSDLTHPLSEVRLFRPATIEAGIPTREAIAVLAKESSGGVVVVQDGIVVGIFTERDVLKKVAGTKAGLDRPVSEFMTPDPVVLREDDTMAVALNKMGTGGFRHLPLVRDGRPVAMVTAREVMNWLLGKFFD